MLRRLCMGIGLWVIAYTAICQHSPLPVAPVAPTCGAAQYLHQYLQNEATSARHAAFENSLYQAISQGDFPESGVLDIPVVVHIVHNNGTANITDAQVQNALAHLNAAYRNTAPYDPATGTDIEISFCLAKQDTAGNPTTGIVRTISPLAYMTLELQDASLKALSRWDPTQYLNIWVVREINSTTYGVGIAGYASSPSQHGQSTDGLVVEANFFGSNPVNSRILIHEAGHYLGLYHTFEGGCYNADCLHDGDRVCDTPPDASTAAVSCGTSTNSCLTDEDDLSSQNPFRPVAWGGTGDQPDMYHNYMDYGHLPCQTAFTPGQKMRMRATLLGVRASLGGSAGCQSLCPTPILPAMSASDTIIQIGDTVWFTGGGTGVSGGSWSINGNSIGTGSSASHIFTQTGIFTVQWIAENGNPACSDSISINIEVLCPVQVQITASNSQPNPGDTVIFTATLSGGTPVGWYEDGIWVGSGLQIAYPFPTGGLFSVNFVASGALCSTTSEAILVEVGVCGGNKRANHWYFGTFAGMDFSGGAPVLDTLGQLNTLEGNATMSNASGDLLFYTDGKTVWNAQHDTLQNGFGLLGNHSSTQSALIMPYVGSDSLYYIFTAGDLAAARAGIRYSIVDMSLDSGRGAVTVKNRVLLDPSLERLTAVPHCNGTDFWVLCHTRQGRKYHAYLVTAAGVDTLPVITEIGIVPGNTFRGSIGVLKASPDASRLAVATNPTTTPESYSFEVFDFDNRTGKLSNPIELNIVADYSAYAVEFSPNGNFLYATAFPLTPPGMDHFWQFDLNAGSQTDILNSAYSLTSTSNTLLTGLQIGPDGKIYVSKADGFLGVVNSPSIPGPGSNFVYNGFSLGSTTALIALPNFPSSMFYDYAPEILGPAIVCSQTLGVEYQLAAGGCFQRTVNWRAGGGALITAQSDTAVWLDFGGAGNDTLFVEVSLACGQTLADTLVVTVRPDLAPAVHLGMDTALCGVSSLTLDAGAGFTGYLWQDSTSAQTYTATQAGTYWVQVKAPNGCFNSDTLRVLQDDSLAPPDLGADTSLCAGQVLVLDAGPGFASYSWQDGSPNATLTAWNPGLYHVSTTDFCGAVYRDSIWVQTATGPMPYLGTDTTICPGQFLTMDAGAGMRHYLWQDGSANQTLQTGDAGWVWCEVTDSAGCAGRDSLRVNYHPVPAPMLGPDTLLCLGQTITLNAGAGGQFLWSTGDTSSSIVHADSGWVWVETTNGFGCTGRDSLFISVDICDALDAGSAIDMPRIYPNPSTGQFRISGLSGSVTSMEVTVWDLLGRRVDFPGKMHPQATIHLPKLPTGKYIIRLKTADNLYHLPLEIHAL